MGHGVQVGMICGCSYLTHPDFTSSSLPCSLIHQMLMSPFDIVCEQVAEAGD